MYSKSKLSLKLNALYEPCALLPHLFSPWDLWQGGVCLAFADEVLCWLYGTVKESKNPNNMCRISTFSCFLCLISFFYRGHHSQQFIGTLQMKTIYCSLWPRSCDWSFFKLSLALMWSLNMLNNCSHSAHHDYTHISIHIYTHHNFEHCIKWTYGGGHSQLGGSF